jgi:hypothetical protein
MITSEHKIRSCFGRHFFMVVIIACYCFSSGEGLRLRPFPELGLEEAETGNAQLHGDASNETSTSHHRHSVTSEYSPAIASSRQLKRGKQQEIQWSHGCPPAQSNRDLTADPIILATARGAMDIVSVFRGSHIPSRAPPFASYPFAA